MNNPHQEPSTIITVKAFAILRTLMQNETRLGLGGGSIIADLLRGLELLYPGLSVELFSAPGHLDPLVNILKNGRNIQHLQNLQTPLEEGDLIAVFPSAAGDKRHHRRGSRYHASQTERDGRGFLLLSARPQFIQSFSSSSAPASLSRFQSGS